VPAGRGGDAGLHDASLPAGYIEGVVDAGDGSLGRPFARRDGRGPDPPRPGKAFSRR
jgi:hypothetical protein